MKKIKIFADTNDVVVEEAVNEFLVDHPVSVEDIQYRMSDDGKYSVMHSVMIVYDPMMARLDKRDRSYYDKVIKAGETE